MKVEELQAYELLEKRTLPDLNSEGYLLRHRKTGARIVLLSNEDENKVFDIAFRTPPEDSTGVAHIIEHTVLCGSREFPVKDPFIEMAKGSLNTFLNAMTYPDKTVYPVASCNDKDFQNLMHIYLDAVFYPNIYQNEKIFRQEGWHYELENPEGELTVNGVVYNEMKGAYSSPDDVLFREISKSLYPDTTYGVSSGGDPEEIPELSYEQFLDFHRRYYHPSNSFIYLYGNMDMAEKLTFIDEHYLSAFDSLSVDSEIKRQKPFAAPIRVQKEYPVGDGENEEEGAYLSYNVVVGDALDPELYEALPVIDYALCSAPGAPLKQALVDKGLGKDVYSEEDNGVLQPNFSVIAKGADASREQEFVDTIKEVAGKIVREGFDKKALLAGINYHEFKYREADYGWVPKGLMYGLQILDSWLYDENRPFLHVEGNAVFATLRKRVDEGYFEKLLADCLLDNPHCSVVVLTPRKGLAALNEEKWKAHMAQIKAGMSAEELNAVMAADAALKAYQEEEDSDETKACLPFLTREDMKKEAAKPSTKTRFVGKTKVLCHDTFTNGIGYVKLMFDLSGVPESHYPYIGILKGVLGAVDTEHYSYGALFNEINILTGGIAASTSVYEDARTPDAFAAFFEMNGKALYENIPRMLTLMEEMLFTSNFADGKRLKEILAEGKMRMSAQMISAGHSVALGRALSYESTSGVIKEVLSGLPVYRLTCELEENFAERSDDLTRRLMELSQMIFRPENLTVDFTGTQEGYEKLAGALASLSEKLYDCPVERGHFLPEPERLNEGFKTAGQVQYVCRAGNFAKKGFPYTGALRVLKVYLDYEYLWNTIRVKGGAYGCGSSFRRTGSACFYSYRDPNLTDTLEVYSHVADAVASFDASERTMTQYIIGAIGELDTPMTPMGFGSFSLGCLLSGISDDDLQKERDQLLSVTPQDIRNLADYVRAFLEDDLMCVVGNGDRIEEDKEIFLHVEELA